MSATKNNFNPTIKYISVPEADVQIKENKQDELTIQNSHPVKIPKNEQNDFRIAIFASDINEMRENLNIKPEKFSWSEIMLAISTTCGGLSIGAFLSGTHIDSWQGIISIILLLIFVSTGTAYFFIRKNDAVNLSVKMQQVLKKLPDPKEEEKL